MEVRLIYASQSTRAMTESDLTDVLKTARKNNERNGISGLLLYCSQSFLQVLEGDPAEVDATYQHIQADPRHKNLRLLSRSPIDNRKYDEWSMGFDHVNESDIVAAFPGYKPATEYPLVSADLIRNAAVAETMLELHQRNSPQRAGRTPRSVIDRSLAEFIEPPTTN